MFKNRSFNSFVGLTIVVLAVLSIGSLAFAQPTLPVSETNQLAPLDWYFSHEHANVDSDNNVVSAVNIPVNSSPLDWYFSHDHAIIDGDNNVVSRINIPVGERYSTLKNKQLEQFDAARFASANITTADEENAYRTTQPSLTGWWEYCFSDALHTTWYANHYVTTPAGPVIDATYTFPGKALGSANGCGLSRSEPDC